jgi:hypothetical protein
VNMVLNFGFHKNVKKIVIIGEQQSASQEGLSSMELVMILYF